MAETSFSFKKALENIDKTETFEEQVDNFLKSVILITKNKHIKRNDINEIQFSILIEETTCERLPLYGIYVSYLLEEFGEKYCQIHCLRDIKFAIASFLLQGIEKKLEKEGLKCENNFIFMREKDDKIRDGFKVKL